MPWLLGFALVVCVFGVVVVPLQRGEPAREVILTALPGLLFISTLLGFFLWILLEQFFTDYSKSIDEPGT